MAWLKESKIKQFNVGDVLKNKATGQQGVMVKDFSGHYIVECSTAPDTPFKRETRDVSHQDASDNWSKAGSVKLLNHLTNELEEVICEKTHKKQWLEFPMHKIGSQVTLNSDHDVWIVVASYGDDKYGVILGKDLNSHEVITPTQVHSQDLLPYSMPDIQVGTKVEDGYYGTGTITSTASYHEDGTVEVSFGDLFKVRNYQVPATVTRVSVQAEPIILCKCPTDGSYHSPCCMDHLDLPEEPKKASLIKKAAKITAEIIAEHKKHLQALLKGISLDMFTPELYRDAKAVTPAPEIGEVDIIHLASSVVQKNTKRTGIIVAANLNDWSVKVRWDDDSSETPCWRQELLRKTYIIQSHGEYVPEWPILVSPEGFMESIHLDALTAHLENQLGYLNVHGPTIRGDRNILVRVKASTLEEALQVVQRHVQRVNYGEAKIKAAEPTEQGNLF